MVFLILQTYGTVGTETRRKWRRQLLWNSYKSCLFIQLGTKIDVPAGPPVGSPAVVWWTSPARPLSSGLRTAGKHRNSHNSRWRFPAACWSRSWFLSGESCTVGLWECRWVRGCGCLNNHSIIFSCRCFQMNIPADMHTRVRRLETDTYSNCSLRSLKVIWSRARDFASKHIFI